MTLHSPRIGPTERACPCCGRPIAITKHQAALELIPMSPQQREIINALAADFGEWISMDSITDTVWGDDPDGGPLSPSDALSVQLNSIRPRLREHGFAVDVRWNRSASWRRLVLLPGAA